MHTYLAIDVHAVCSRVVIIGELGAAMNRHFVYKTVGFMTPMGFLIRKANLHPVGLVGVH